MTKTYEKIYTTVCRIPYGKVSSYGRVADLAGFAGQARLVGYALHALRTNTYTVGEIPWWRVINAAGRISNEYEPQMQRSMLETEGVSFNTNDRVDFARFLWDGDAAHEDGEIIAHLCNDHDT